MGYFFTEAYFKIKFIYLFWNNILVCLKNRLKLNVFYQMFFLKCPSVLVSCAIKTDTPALKIAKSILQFKV